MEIHVKDITQIIADYPRHRLAAWLVQEFLMNLYKLFVFIYLSLSLYSLFHVLLYQFGDFLYLDRLRVVFQVVSQIDTDIPHLS